MKATPIRCKFYDTATEELLGEITDQATELAEVKRIFDFHISKNGDVSVGRALYDGTKPKIKNLFEIDPVSSLYTQEVLEICVARALLRQLSLFNIRVEEVLSA